MKKIIFIWFLFLVAPLVASTSSINIEIDIKDSFNLEETVNFDYMISSDTSLQIIYMDYITCLNAPRAGPEQKNVFLNPREQLRETHSDFVIDETIEPQTCTAYVQVLSPIPKIVSKNFTINTDSSFSFDIKLKKKIFLLNENIYIDYTSDVESPSITSTLTYPDKTTKQITLPTSIKAEQIGTYNLEVTASKQGYKTVSLKGQFGVIESEAVISGEVISKDKDKTKGLFFDIGGKNKYLIYFSISAVIIVLVVLIIFFITRKRRSTEINNFNS